MSARDDLDVWMKSEGNNMDDLIGWSVASAFAEWYADKKIKELKLSSNTNKNAKFKQLFRTIINK